MQKLLCLLCLLVSAALARGGEISATGQMPAGDPNAVVLLGFRLLADGDLHFQTYGYGGSASAPGGVNAAGQAVAPGGFDPYLSLFLGLGPGATFLASNDDGACPPGTAAPACADSTLDLLNVPAGYYTLALTLPFNFSFAENLGSGTLGDGFIGLDASFSDGACGGVCSSVYAFDIVSNSELVAVPAPATLLLVLAGLLLLARPIHKGAPK
ncbi:DVUA0089 family protein [Massilia endophytica]|uniref:DVUA0089 family protein n=1 Tax=Massilia endophytica TaxID=2899220 RepID=UPI001E5A737E|nr:DVUA0089 family protein [Massilia endophytica]UGQ44656.1 DVUA0089 family protein [Massilia endophytica]